MKEKKSICLIDEIEISIELIKKGLSELQSIDGANDLYHAPIILLSGGFERLIKCLLCLAFMDEEGNFKEKPFEYHGRKGHDLYYLINKILKICEKKNYSTKFPAAETDIEMLKNDEYLKEIINHLSNFAQGGRYYNLDIVLEGESDFYDTKQAWEKIEITILNKRKELKTKLQRYKLDEVYREINQELIIILEKFARALSRLFTLGNFGDLAKQVSPLVYDFLMLMDGDLGKRKY